MSKLTHIHDQGSARMVDVSDKPATAREAVAMGFVRMSAETLALVVSGSGRKGDVRAVAELAGVMAHEIGHVAACHAARQQTRGNMANIASLPLLLGGPLGYGLYSAAGIAVQVHDPMADPAHARREYGIELVKLEALQPADAVVLAVAHDAYKAGWPLIVPLLRDGKGVVLDVKARLDRSRVPAGIALWRL